MWSWNHVHTLICTYSDFSVGWHEGDPGSGEEVGHEEPGGGSQQGGQGERGLRGGKTVSAALWGLNGGPTWLSGRGSGRIFFFRFSARARWGKKSVFQKKKCKVCDVNYYHTTIFHPTTMFFLLFVTTMVHAHWLNFLELFVLFVNVNCLM